jgi:hypothetical protein
MIQNSDAKWTYQITPYLEPQKSQNLPPQPTKALDLWRIKGGGLDLHLHRRDLLSPLICLRDLCLGFPWIPRLWFVYLISWYLLFDNIVLSLGASNSVVDACPKIVKISSALRKPLVESELGLCGKSLHRRIGWAFVALVRPLWQPHPSNVDVLPLKVRNYGNHILVSACSNLGYLYPLLPLLIVSWLACYLSYS